MDKKHKQAAKEINKKLELVPQIPVGKIEMMARLREMKAWIGLEEVLSKETVKVIKKLR